ncbi:DsrE/DsrF/DrsH-like family protein [Haladaptatus sp. NG-SE-30]
MNGFAIVLASEDIEKIQAASIIGSVAAASDIPVDIFVTMNGLNPFEKEAVEHMDFKGGRVAEAMMTATEVHVPLFTEQLEQAKELGPLSVYACTMAMDMLGNTLDDYVDVFDDELGVAGFLEMAQDKNVIFV